MLWGLQLTVGQGKKLAMRSRLAFIDGNHQLMVVNLEGRHAAPVAAEL